MNLILHHRKTKISFLKEVLPKVRSVEIPRRAAALAFYAISAIAPLIIIFIGVSGLIIDRSLAETTLLSYFQNKVGDRSVFFLQETIESLKKSESHLTFSFIGFLITFYGLLHFFKDLKKSFFLIFDVSLGFEKSLKKTFGNFLKSLSFSFFLAFLILLLIFISAVLPLIISFGADTLGWHFFAKNSILNFIIVFIATILILSLMYKIVSLDKITWKSAFIGALLSAALLTFLNVGLLGYLNLFHTSNAIYGVSGSFITLLLWIYYSTQILLIGAVVAAMAKANQIIYLK